MGNTSAVLDDFALIWDHPHIHGEYKVEGSGVRATKGSPPHTWGIRYNERVDTTRQWDHPHIHGEYDKLGNWVVADPGSPPHTWGIH